MNTILLLLGSALCLAGIFVMVQAVGAMRTHIQSTSPTQAQKYAGLLVLPNKSVPIIRDFRALHPSHALLKRLPLASGLIVFGILLFLTSSFINGSSN